MTVAKNHEYHYYNLHTYQDQTCQDPSNNLDCGESNKLAPHLNSDILQNSKFIQDHCTVDIVYVCVCFEFEKDL